MNNTQIDILLADDDEVDYIAVKRICKKLNLHLDYAENGEVAYQKLRERPYQLLITDIDMPTMNGLELVKSIRSSGDPLLSHIVVAAVSGTKDQSISSNFKHLGFDFFFPKPVSLEGLQPIFKNLNLI